jgi:uncharacterized membrane protein
MSQAERKLHGHLALAGCTAALLTLVPVAAHQLGALDHLPDPPSPIFDSDAITESKTAHPLGIPDSLLGLGSYGVTLALLLAARRRAPLASTLLGLKLTADASAATGNAVRQVVKFRRLCSWCTGTALATGVMVYYGRKFLKD